MFSCWQEWEKPCTSDSETDVELSFGMHRKMESGYLTLHIPSGANTPTHVCQKIAKAKWRELKQTKHVL